MQKLHYSSTSSRGFTLPVILLISVGLMIVGLSLLQASTSIRSSLDYEYQRRLDTMAAEAGVAYAKYCLKASGFNQTWGPAVGKPNLTQKTDCNGDPLASAPSYLMVNGTRRTSFSIGDLSVRNDGAIIFPATGTYEQTRGNTSQIANTSSSLRRQLVAWKTYRPSVSASGTSKTCAIVSNELYCWGRNDNSGSDNFGGQLGDGTTNNSTSPVKVVQAPGVLAGKVIDDVVSAQYHNCALTEGKVYCWGQNDDGQLGDGTNNDRSTPVAVRANVGDALYNKTVTAIGASGNTTCAIATGKIYCWGGNADGTVGDGTTNDRYVPTAVSTTNLGASYTATAFSRSGSRSYNMCAIVDGKAWCWGPNEAGQIGNNTSGSTDIRVPTKVYDGGVLAGKTVTSISQDGYNDGSPAYPHVCAVANGEVFCWGENNAGQLGRSSVNPTRTTRSSIPVAVYTGGVLSGLVVQEVAVGLQHSCVLANSKAYCWGSRGVGQVGDGVTSSTPAYVPTAVAELAGGLLGKTITGIGGGANRGCAIAGYQSFCWGLNNEGQLGDGTTANRNTPTEAIYLRPKTPSYIF